MRIFKLLLVIALLQGMISLAFAASIDRKQFSENFQTSIIRKQPEQIAQLLSSPSSTSLSVIGQYFECYNLAYATFRLSKKQAILDQLQQCQQIADRLPFYYRAKVALLRANSYGILWRDNEQAINALKQAQTYSDTASHKDNIQLKLDILGALTQAYNQQGDLIKATAYVNQAIALAEQQQITAEIIYNHQLAGRIAYQQADYNQAYSHYFRALSFTDEHTSARTRASIALRLAITFTAQENFQQALEQAQLAVKLYAQTTDIRLQVKSLRVLGTTYLQLGGDTNTALMHFINALSLIKQIDDQLNLGQIQHLIAKSYCLLNQWDQCEHYATAADQALLAANSHYYWALNQLVQAQLLQHNKQLDQAIILLKQTSERADIQPYPDALSQIKQKLIELYSLKADYKSALALQQSITTEPQLQPSKQSSEQLTQLIQQKQWLNQLNDYQIQQQQTQDKLKQSTHYIQLLLLTLALSLIVIWLVSRNNRRKHQQLKAKQQHYQLNWDGLIAKLADHLAPESKSLLICQFKPTLTLLEQLQAQQQLSLQLAAFCYQNKSRYCTLPKCTVFIIQRFDNTFQSLLTTNSAISHAVYIDFSKINASASNDVLQVLISASELATTATIKDQVTITELKLQNNTFAQLSYPITSAQGQQSLHHAVQLGLICFN